jgi:hypothetical protein
LASFFSSRKKSDENHKRSEKLKLLAYTKPENRTWQFFSEPLILALLNFFGCPHLALQY